MLKKRVIVGLLFADGVLTRTKKFIPDYRYTSSFVGVEAADEIVMIDVTPGTGPGQLGPSKNSLAAMRGYADRCFGPITAGGGIRTMDDVKRMFDLGADKVLLGGHHAMEFGGGLIDEVAEKYGSQAATVGVSAASWGKMDRCWHGNVHYYRKLPDKDGKYQTYSGGKVGYPYPDKSVEALAGLAVSRGAGEILLQSIDRDGSLGGYDIPLLRSVLSTVSVPVVIGGGCGGWKHMQEGFEAGASGCLTTVIHHFTDAQLSAMKENLGNLGVLVRPAT